MADLLNQQSRQQFKTLLDAVVLTAADASVPAIIYLETEHEPLIVSRENFRSKTRSYAHALQNLGIGARDMVAIAHTQNLESIYAFWGAMLVGAIPSMFPTLTEKLDPDIYMNSMAKLVEHSDVKIVLTTDGFAQELSGHVPCP